MTELKLQRELIIITGIILIVNSSFSKEVLKSEDGKEDSTKKDLRVQSASYVYSKIDNGPGSSLSHSSVPIRFRSIHGLNSGLNFPRLSSVFNYPTKYRVGSFGGVGSGFDDISSDVGINRFGLANGLRSSSSGLGISKLGKSDIDSSISSIDSKQYEPLSLKYDEHDDVDGFDEHSKKEEERAEESENEHESTNEKENSKGYKVVEEFDKGEKGEKKQDQESGQYQEEAGEKKGHEILEKKYGENEESNLQSKGDHYSHEKDHKKGHKTTGYHNIYHKDEFKKDTTFYDDAHEDSQQEQYNHADEKHERIEGEHKKAEKIDEAYENADKSQNAFFTNGHQYGVNQGHDRQEIINEHQEKEQQSKHSSSEEQNHSHHSHH